MPRPLTPAQMRAAAQIAQEKGVVVVIEKDGATYRFEPARHEAREDLELRDFSR